jgi:general secretion pathway protein H
MPTLVTGISTERRAQRCRAEGGFSLLELLVVVAIIAVFVGAAVLSLSLVGADPASEQQAARLKGVLDLAREEALMQSRDFGVLFTSSAYRFYVYDYGLQSWLEPADDDLLSEHALDETLEFALKVEDRAILLEDELDPDDLEDPQPQVMILSSGEMTQFEASVSRPADDGEYVLTAAVDGEIEISSRGFEAR